MSRTIRVLAARALAGAALFTAASLLVPQAARAQSIRPEQALLNVSTAFAPSWITGHPTPKGTVDGSWALLAEPSAGVPSDAGSVTVSLAEARPIDGDRALLGRVTARGTRRTFLQ
jgi:hypothetical protein